MPISVIIPTLNEAAHLPATLESLRTAFSPDPDIPTIPPPHFEILVADASSTDSTVALSCQAGARVIPCPQIGRASQMNLAAAAATGDVLWFVHADTRVPPPSVRSILSALGHPACVGGAFQRRFVPAPWPLPLTARLADWRGRAFGVYFGDQTFFIRRSAFTRLGGFKPLPVFEDVDLALRARRLGRVSLLSPPVLSSGRRFQSRGPWRTTAHDAWLTFRYLLGASPDRLAPVPKSHSQARRTH